MIIYKFLEPWEFPLIDHFFDREGVPRLDPQFARVAAAIDEASGEVAGILAFQLVPHVEPLIVEEKYRGTPVWLRLAMMMDKFCKESKVSGVFAQPSSEIAERINTYMGMAPTGRQLWVKTYYNFDNYTADIADGVIQHPLIPTNDEGDKLCPSQP